VVSALRGLMIGAPGNDPRSASAHFTAATRELRHAAGDLQGATHGLTPDQPGIPGDILRSLRAAVQADEDETPAAGTPRSEWTDVQILLAAAYRLADLADALENGLADNLPTADLAEALDIAHTILDAADRRM
jgi:hypothetical protein